MNTIPASHIEDAHKLVADGIVNLFQLSPTTGSTLYFKPDDDITWLGNNYIGVPMTFTEMKRSAETTASAPRMIIGQENIDLSGFKPLVHDGYLDGATIVHKRLLLEHVVGNLDIAETHHYRVRRVEGYSRSMIKLALSTSSDGSNFTMPFLQYYPPDFPAVMIG